MWGYVYILGNGPAAENLSICSTHTSSSKFQFLYNLHKKSPPHFVTEFEKSPTKHLSIPLKSTFSQLCTNCTKNLKSIPISHQNHPETFILSHFHELTSKINFI